MWKNYFMESYKNAAMWPQNFIYKCLNIDHSMQQTQTSILKVRAQGRVQSQHFLNKKFFLY